MEQAGLEPEYNCRDGHCGACRCTLDSGGGTLVLLKHTQGDEIFAMHLQSKNRFIAE